MQSTEVSTRLLDAFQVVTCEHCRGKYPACTCPKSYVWRTTRQRQHSHDSSDTILAIEHTPPAHFSPTAVARHTNISGRSHGRGPVVQIFVSSIIYNP